MRGDESLVDVVCKSLGFSQDGGGRGEGCDGSHACESFEDPWQASRRACLQPFRHVIADVGFDEAE